MKNSLGLRIAKIIIFIPLVLLVFVLGNLAGYVLALMGVVIVQESPWHYAAREFYVYHGRSILQLEPGFIEYDPHLLYRPRNGVFAFDNYEFRTTINSIDGQRRNPYLKTAPEIIILGDSFAQGWGVNDQDTVASALTRDFGLGAVSSGVSSYNTARELYSFRRAVARGIIPRPSNLVIFYCTNDYTENVHFLDHGIKTYTPEDYEAQVARAKDNTTKRSLLVGPLTHHVESLRNGYRKWMTMTKRGLDYGNLYDPDPPVSSAEQVRAFKAILEANLDLIGDMQVTVVAFKGWGGKDEIGPALAAMPRLTNNRQIHVIINTVPNSGYFPLDGHLNERGSRQLAKLIAEQITRTTKDGETASR